MGWLDEVPRSGGLYIGGLHALYQKQELFRENKITHILSVLDYDIFRSDHNNQLGDYTKLQIRLEDDPNEDLLQHFATTNAFIAAAVGEPTKGRVFIHCAMGKSRSATVVCAYLMWKFGRTPAEALEQLCEGRPICSPNPGFLEQLQVYHRMLQAKDQEVAERIYDTWIKERFTGPVWSWEKRSELAKL